MKSKLYISIFIFGLLFTSAVPAYAVTPVTGSAFGENIGMVHMDYETAISPFPACPPENASNPNCTSSSQYSNYHFGFRNEFYIDNIDFNFAGPGNSNTTASVSDVDSCTSDECYLKGYIWSNSIGWILLDGQIISSQGFPSDPSLFPQEDYAKINRQGVVSGYIWSKDTGWIKLSSDGFNPNQPITTSNWGMYMNFSDEKIYATNANCVGLNITNCNTHPDICQWTTSCQPIKIDRGRKIYGYAWSENLGWIKFAPIGADDDFFGVYTTWIWDDTPPKINAFNGAWFANNHINGTISWPYFASDPDSGINLMETELQLESITPGCVNGMINVTHYGASNYDIQLTIPNAGLLNNQSYCEYKITGEVVNEFGLKVVMADADPGDIEAPSEYKEPITFYVRAGEFDYDQSDVEIKDPAEKIADGVDTIEYRLHARDIADNPIVPVKVDVDGSPTFDSDDWMRTANTEFSFDGDNMYFDPITFITNLKNRSDTLPIKISDIGAGTVYSEDDDVIFDLADSLSNFYPVQVSAWAPTVCKNCSSFTMNGVVFEVDDAELPPITDPIMPETDKVDAVLNTYDDIAENTDITTPFIDGLIEYSFLPAVTIGDAELGAEPLVVSTSNYMQFKLFNNSTSKTITDVSVDNIMSLYDDAPAGTYAAELFEFQDIYLGDSAPPIKGITDPWTRHTRFEAFNGVPVDNAADNASSTAFHSEDFNYHIPTYWFFNTPVDTNGVYTYSEGEGEDINILRSDYNDFDLLANGSNTFKVNFKPEFILETPIDHPVGMDVKQYIGYRMSDRVLSEIDDFAIYEPPALITGLELKPVGIAATGIITGKNIYDVIGEREFETVTSPDLAKLKQQMRDNATQLTRNITACDADSTIINAFTTTNSDCVRVDDHNNTVVAVYGGADELLEIGETGGTITVPDGYRYTIIVKGGANVFIKDNIKYDTVGSFGLIVLADDNGNGGNVLIDTDVTNIVGMLYAEGSILSSEDGEDLCYTDDVTCDLNNQLYWQGSIVSKNTIGGAPGRRTPQGVNCEDWGITNDLRCAQAFDLDYVRRFTVRALKDVATDDILGYYTPEDRLFSGGGSCNVAPDCSLGPLPTTINLSATADGNNLINIDTSKSINTFFIEKDARPAPPGFTIGAGFERTIEIR